MMAALSQCGVSIYTPRELAGTELLPADLRALRGRCDPSSTWHLAGPMSRPFQPYDALSVPCKVASSVASL